MIGLLIFLVPVGLFLLGGSWVLAGAGGVLGIAALCWMGESPSPSGKMAWAAMALALGLPLYAGEAITLWGMGVPLVGLGVLSMAGKDGDKVPGGFLFSALIGGLVCGWFGLQGGNAKKFPPLLPKERIVVFGDSLAAGVNGDGVGTRWPEILAEEVNAEVLNFSNPGDTLDQSFSRWDDVIVSQNWKYGDKSWKPDLIIVELGGNDIKKAIGTLGLKEALQKWVDGLAMTGADILLVACPGALFSDPYADVWEEVAAQHESVHWMNQKALRSIFGRPQYTIPDKIHFNQQGHEYFAQFVANRLRGEV